MEIVVPSLRDSHACYLGCSFRGSARDPCQLMIRRVRPIAGPKPTSDLDDPTLNHCTAGHTQRSEKHGMQDGDIRDPG